MGNCLCPSKPKPKRSPPIKTVKEDEGPMEVHVRPKNSGPQKQVRKKSRDISKRHEIDQENKISKNPSQNQIYRSVSQISDKVEVGSLPKYDFVLKEKESKKQDQDLMDINLQKNHSYSYEDSPRQDSNFYDDFGAEHELKKFNSNRTDDEQILGSQSDIDWMNNFNDPEEVYKKGNVIDSRCISGKDYKSVYQCLQTIVGKLHFCKNYKIPFSVNYGQ